MSIFLFLTTLDFNTIILIDLSFTFEEQFL